MQNFILNFYFFFIYFCFGWIFLLTSLMWLLIFFLVWLSGWINVAFHRVNKLFWYIHLILHSFLFFFQWLIYFFMNIYYSDFVCFIFNLFDVVCFVKPSFILDTYHLHLHLYCLFVVFMTLILNLSNLVKYRKVLATFYKS